MRLLFTPSGFSEVFPMWSQTSCVSVTGTLSGLCPDLLAQLGSGPHLGSVGLSGGC